MQNLIPKIKKYFIIYIFLLILPLVVCAECEGTGDFLNPFDVCTVEELLEKIGNFIFWLAFSGGVAAGLVGAFFISTGGVKIERVKTGRTIIFYATLGLAALLFTRGLMALAKHFISQGAAS